MAYKINYFDSFECIGGSCENTCCRGWNISIDQSTYEFYLKQEGEFGKFLGKNVEQMGERYFIKMTEESLCPFLDENKLCRIYREYGPEHQAVICQNFPRNRRSEGCDTTFYMLSLSCEAVLRQIFYQSEPIHLIWEEEKMDYSVSHPSEMRLAEFINWSMGILQDESFSLDIALGIVLYTGLECITKLMDVDVPFSLPSNKEVQMLLHEFQLVKQDVGPKELEKTAWSVIFSVVDIFCNVVHETDFYNGDIILWDNAVFSYTDDGRKKYLYEAWERNKNSSFPSSTQKRRLYASIITKHMMSCGVDTAEDILIGRVCNYIVISEILPFVWQINTEEEYFALLAQLGRLFEQTTAIDTYVNPIIQKLLHPDILSYILAFMVLF